MSTKSPLKFFRHTMALIKPITGTLYVQSQSYQGKTPTTFNINIYRNNNKNSTANSAIMTMEPP